MYKRAKKHIQAIQYRSEKHFYLLKCSPLENLIHKQIVHNIFMKYTHINHIKVPYYATHDEESDIENDSDEDKEVEQEDTCFKKMFKKVPKYLPGSYDLDLTQISGVEPQYYFSAFKNLSKIKRLKMSLSRQLIQSPYMKKYFNNKLYNLDKLQVSFYNEPSEQDYEIFYNCISNMKELRTLKIQYIENSELNVNQLRTIFQNLQKLQNLKNLKLDMEGVKIKSEDSGNQKLFKYIGELKHLQSLKLKFRKAKLSHQDIQFLMHQIDQISNLQQLSLDFIENQLGLQSVQVIKKIILKLAKLRSLSINLSYNDLTNNALLEFISNLNTLTEISNLKLNLKQKDQLKGEESENIFKEILKFKNLRRLAIGFQISCEGFISLMKNIQQLDQLEFLQLDLQKQGLGDNEKQNQQIFVLCQHIQKWQSLRELKMNLQDNKIKPSMFSNIVDSIGKLQKLSTIQIDLQNNGYHLGDMYPVSNDILRLYKIYKLNVSVNINDDIESGDMRLNEALHENKVQHRKLEIDCWDGWDDCESEYYEGKHFYGRKNSGSFEYEKYSFSDEDEDEEE